MLLCELTGIKKYQSMTLQDILVALDNTHDIKKINAGEYGTILSSPHWGDDCVVKIFEDDPPYLEFINYVLGHPNKHYPKIIRKPISMHAFYTRNKSASNRLWIVKIEKLNEIFHIGLRGFIARYIAELSSVAWRIEANKIDEIPLAQRAKRAFKLPNGTVVQMTCEEIFKELPWAYTLSVAFHNAVYGCHLGAPDIHADNFMVRKDGTIVIIDPLWEGASLSFPSDTPIEYGDEGPPTVSGTDYEIRRNTERKRLADRERMRAQSAADILAREIDEIPF